MLAAILSAWLAVWGPLIESWTSSTLLLFIGAALVCFALVAFFKRGEKHWIDVAHLIVVTAAFIAACIAGYWTYKQAEYSEQQAKAAREQNKLNQDTARRQVRAYVIFDASTITFSNNKRSYFLDVRVKNSGTTPAFNLVHSWKSEVVRRLSLRPTVEHCAPEKDGETYDLAGNADIALGDHRLFQLAEGQYESIKSGEQAIVVTACFEYKDSFQKTQDGRFKLVNRYTPNEIQRSEEEAKKMRLFVHGMSDD